MVKNSFILTAMLLVAAVTAIVLVIAPHCLIDAPMCGVASELVQPTWGARLIGTVLLVGFVATVQITVAPLLLGQAEFPIGWRVSASEVVGLTFSVVCERRERKHSLK